MTDGTQGRPDVDDKIRRAYVRLTAIKKTYSFVGQISDTVVNEYHAALNHLTDLGFDVQEFRIPQSEMKREVISVSMRRGGTTEFGDGFDVDGAFFKMKLEAVLAYFVEGESAAPRNIGFRG